MNKPRILIVDDLADNIELIKSIFQDEPYIFDTAGNGLEALIKIEKHSPDVILLDVIMPIMDGYQVCEKLKNNPATKLIPIIMLTGLEDSASKIKGINLGVDDFISKPINLYELKARVASLIRLKQYTDQLEYAEQIIFSLALAVEAKDSYTKGHCNRLANYGGLLAEKANLSAKDIKTVRRGGILHDIGKLAIQDQILLKPGPLSKDEYNIIKTHPEAGEKICRPLKTLEDVLPIIRYHQERFDGSGYPDGLRGESIPLMARIVAMVDSYDALTTDRPYRPALSEEQALRLLDVETEKGLWDKELFNIFKEILSDEQISEKVNRDSEEIKALN